MTIVRFDLAVLDSSDGFTTNAPNGNVVSLNDVSEAGDVNGDGIADFFHSSWGARDEGITYVVFGANAGFPALFELAGLNGANGFAIHGAFSGDVSGRSISYAGDLNGDGYDDLVIGAVRFDSYSDGNDSKAYVVFGGAGPFPGNINLSSLNGSNGFKIVSSVASADPWPLSYLGFSVSDAGDVNDDGFADIIVGDHAFDASYVVFGSNNGFPSVFDVDGLDGTNGFKIYGASGSAAGFAVSSAGDVNGDGIADLLIGSATRDFQNGAFPQRAYVVFGSSSPFQSTFDLTNLDGTNGFQVTGLDSNIPETLSLSSAGDFNGDGIDDLIIGLFSANGFAGEAFIIYGRNDGIGPNIDVSTLDGSNGFKISGGVSGGNYVWYTGIDVSSAGDVNADGFDDLIVSAHAANPNGIWAAGAVYIVFGDSGSNSPTLNLIEANGLNAMALNGLRMGIGVGRHVSAAGDVNGDGIDDIIVDGPGISSIHDSVGETFVIYGSTSFGTITGPTKYGDDLYGTSLPDAIDGGLGTDLIDGGGSDDSLIGGIGSDTLIGGDGEDLLLAGDGNDSISAGSGADVIDGGNGVDILDYRFSSTGIAVDLGLGAGTAGDAAGDAISGIEIVYGSRKDDTIGGDGSANDLRGSIGADVLRGVEGKDTLDGGVGDDTILGGDNPDTLIGGAGADIFDGGISVDKVDYTKASTGVIANLRLGGVSGDAAGDMYENIEILSGSRYSDVFTGSYFNDDLRGRGGNDFLDGSLGGDKLNGGSGNDTIIGGSGRDTLTGGGHNDKFLFSGNFGADVITDFNSGVLLRDVIVIEGFGPQFDSFAEILSAASQIGGNTVINLGGGNTITLQKVIMATLDVNDFLFG